MTCISASPCRMAQEKRETISLKAMEDHFTKEQIETLRQHDEAIGKFDWHKYSVSRFASFSRAERLAIIRYLEFRVRDEYEAPRISQALEGYWRPSAQ